MEYGSVFERAAKRAPSERRVQLTIRGFLSTQIEAIDQLVNDAATDSRSELVLARWMSPFLRRTELERQLDAIAGVQNAANGPSGDRSAESGS